MREVRTITKHEELKAISEYMENLSDRHLRMVNCFILGLLGNSVPARRIGLMSEIMWRKQNEETPTGGAVGESR